MIGKKLPKDKTENEPRINTRIFKKTTERRQQLQSPNRYTRIFFIHLSSPSQKKHFVNKMELDKRLLARYSLLTDRSWDWPARSYIYKEANRKRCHLVLMDWSSSSSSQPDLLARPNKHAIHTYAYKRYAMLLCPARQQIS